jgi:hypothetical protein
MYDPTRAFASGGRHNTTATKRTQFSGVAVGLETTSDIPVYDVVKTNPDAY